MKTLGIVLVVIGILALVYGGISYTKKKSVLDLGAVEITSTEHKSFPIPVAVGALVLIGGVVVLASGARRSPAA